MPEDCGRDAADAIADHAGRAVRGRITARRSLMDALGTLGERARALRHYERFTGFLARELGTKPSSETRAIAERLARE